MELWSRSRAVDLGCQRWSRPPLLALLSKERAAAQVELASSSATGLSSSPFLARVERRTQAAMEQMGREKADCPRKGETKCIPLKPKPLLPPVVDQM